jgi:hypothetical protein
MDDRTGNLLPLEEVKKLSLKDQKHFVEIPERFLPEIEGLNRHERRKWLKLHRKELDGGRT